MTDVEKRIRLAEAMKLDIVAIRNDGGGNVRVSVRYPDAEHGVNFDPFRSADDDYQVLCWLRGSDRLISQAKADRLNFHLGRPIWDYKVGDIARAALQLISDD